VDYPPRVRESTDVVVVGAGLSGLVAARQVAARSRKVVVLEARDRVGGRTYTVPFAGAPIDLGGQWLGPTQDRAYTLCRELGITTFPQFLGGDRLLDLDDGAPRAYRGTVPPVPLLQSADTGQVLARLEVLSRVVPLEAPWRARLAERWDRLSIEDWLGRAAFSDGARQMARIAVQMILCAEPRDVSFLYFLFYLRSGGGLLRLAEVKNGAQQDRITGGAQRIADKLAAKVDVRLSTPVRRLTQDATGVTVEADGLTVRAGRAIVAVPPALAAKIDFTPAIPRQALHPQMPMGTIVKVIVAYDRGFWRGRGLTGEALSLGAPCRAFFDDSLEAGGHPALVGFVVGEPARRFGSLPVAERRAAVLAQLGRIFGDEATRCSAYVDHDWTADPWSAGCYVGLMGPGVMTRLGPTLREPCGRLHFAGTETATKWAGYLEGAIEAGERAAGEVYANG
jgi:monoamine oxidase